MQKDQRPNEEIASLFRVSAPTYFFGVISITASLSGLVLNIGWTPVLNLYNVGLAAINLVLLVTVLFFYFRSYYVFYKLDDISKRMKAAVVNTVGEANVSNAFRVSKLILWYCRNVWVTIIFGWIALYVFILMCELGYMGFEEDTRNLLLRFFNYVDTTQFLILYSVFSSAEPSLKFKNIIIRYWPIFCLLSLTVVLDLGLYLLFADLELAILFNLIGGVLSALAFIMFFARLDSILLQLNKIMLSILMLYGLLQTLYPLLLSSSFELSSSMSLGLYLFSFFIGGTAKVYIAVLFSSTRYLERFIFYFSSVYFLAPATKHRLSIGHTFYAAKALAEEE